MRVEDIKSWVDIGNGILTIFALLAGAWWFFGRLSLAGNLQITLKLTDVALVNNIPIGVVRIQIKNVGQTRVIKDYCACLVEEVELRPDSEHLHVISKERLNYSQGKKIFRSLVEIEPNEETSEDIVIVLNKASLFTVGVRCKKKGSNESWQAIATFNADVKTKNLPSTSTN